jgi:hypothetical protein
MFDLNLPPPNGDQFHATPVGQTNIFYEFPSRLGLNKVSYCIRSLKLEYIFSGKGEKRSVFVGCNKFLMGNLDVRKEPFGRNDRQNPNSPASLWFPGESHKSHTHV